MIKIDFAFLFNFKLHLSQCLYLYHCFFDNSCPLIDNIKWMRGKVTSKCVPLQFLTDALIWAAVIMDKEGDSSQKILESSYGSRGIISHMWQILTFSFNSKELPRSIWIFMATIMVELQWSQRKGRSWSFCRFSKCQEQSSYIFQAVESHKILWATE